jgi:N-acetylglucosaminyldiphosphoundecaprenol N-acetyl-beta-D-mannosaminyltransferase
MTIVTNLEDDSLLLDRRENVRSLEFLGVDFVPLDFQQTIERVTQKAQSNDAFCYMTTPNVDHLVRLSKDESLLHIYQNSWINVSDSRILEIMAKFSNIDLPPVPGSDLTAHLLENVIAENEDITIIGGDADLVEIIGKKYNVKTHWHEPPMGLKKNIDAQIAAAKFIAQSPARYHFVVVGSPQQELVCEQVLKLGNAKGIGLCVGASLDFLAGKAKRAPLWMQKYRLEWLYRLLSEPKRMWKRYLIDGPRIFSVWLKWRKGAKV